MDINVQPNPVDEASLSSRINIKDDKTIDYVKKGFGQLNTDRPLSSVRLELALDESGLTQDELAKLADVEQATISRIIMGKTKKSRFIPNIAKALGLNSEWLAGLEQQDIIVKVQDNTLRISDENFILVRMYEDANNPNALKDKNAGRDSTIMIAAQLVSDNISHNDLRFVYSEDRANAPEITPGAAVTFNLKEEEVTPSTNGDYFVIKHGKNKYVRTLFLEPDGSIRVRAKQENFPEYTVNTENDPTFQILGRVLFVTNKY